jgi:predicted patatin/cPLA2 family phospholipase
VAKDEVPGFHPVLRLIAERAASGSLPGARDDGYRLAVGIQGGSMRGALTAGMALALHELGLTSAFDDVYGSSAGAITSAWLCSANPAGMRIWTDETLARALIKPGNLARKGRPVLDVETLIEQVYPTVMDFGSVLDSPLRLHPLATDVETGVSVDLRPCLTSARDLRLALRASCAIPVITRSPITLAGHRYFDSGLSESFPYKTAMAQGATHVLVLCSQTFTSVAGASWSLSARLLAATVLRRYPRPLRETFIARNAMLVSDQAPLHDGHPEIYPIWPAPDSPKMGGMTRDGTLISAGFEAGRAAVAAAFTALLPGRVPLA